MSEAEPARILRDTHAITVVGISDDPARPSNTVARYLLTHTEYDVSFVNPRLSTVFDHRVYPSLAHLPVSPELVVVFRRLDQVPVIAEEAIAAGARTLWLQLGLRDDAVADRAREAGLAVVMDHCVKIEHEALIRGE